MASGFFKKRKNFFHQLRFFRLIKGVKTFVYQTQEKGCGFATVKMALIHASGRRQYAYAAEPSVERAPDLATLLSYARERGLRLRALKTPEPAELLESAEFPVILALREDGPLHLVYVSRRKGKRFRVLDPERGPYWAKGEALAKSFIGVYLKIESYEEEGDASRFPTQAPLVHPLTNVFAAMIAFLPMALMLLGLTFLDYSFPSWAVLIAFLAGVGASLFQRVWTLASMRRFDKRYLCGIDEPHLRQRKSLYVHYHAFKRAAFIGHGEILSRFAMVAACFAIFLLHDVCLAASGAIGLVLLSFAHLAFSPSLHRLCRQGELDEERYLYGSLGAVARQESLAALSSRADRYGRLLGAKEAVTLLLGVGLAFFACYFGNELSLQSFLFDFVSLSFLLFETERIFQIEPLLKEKEREETYFRVHILPRVMETESER